MLRLKKNSIKLLSILVLLHLHSGSRIYRRDFLNWTSVKALYMYTHLAQTALPFWSVSATKQGSSLLKRADIGQGIRPFIHDHQLTSCWPFHFFLVHFVDSHIYWWSRLWWIYPLESITRSISLSFVCLIFWHYYLAVEFPAWLVTSRAIRTELLATRFLFELKLLR